MSNISNYPTILYPNGGEVIIGNEITISWIIPFPEQSIDFENLSLYSLSTIDLLDFSQLELNVGNVPIILPIVFDLYYTDNFDPLKEPDWKQIAVVPEGTTQYVWRFSNRLRSSNVRVGIRARNSQGQRTIFSVSANDFSIKSKKLYPPVIVSPIQNGRYDKTIEIITDDFGLINTYSERSSYQFYYSSVSANIPLTAIEQNILIGSGPTIWNTINLPPANDYILQSYLEDEEGNISDSTFTNNIQIVHEGVFIIDTKPPISSIIINNNATFTQNPNVTVGIVSYDEATAVHSMQLTDGTNLSVPESITDTTPFELSNGDAIKTIELLLQDYGGNRNNTQIQRLFKNIIEVTNIASLVDIAIDITSNTAWAITSAPLNYLYKIQLFPSLVTSFNNEPTAIAFFNSFVYIGLKTTNSLGILMQYNGYESIVLQKFTDSDSIINAMTVHKEMLFIGMENGEVYQFDGLVFKQLTGVDNPIRTMYSDGSLLYITTRNETDVYVYNGSTFVLTGA